LRPSAKPTACRAPIALECAADFGLHDRRSPSVEVPPFRLLLSAARKESSSPFIGVPSQDCGNARAGARVSADTKTVELNQGAAQETISVSGSTCVQ
jgi:hypothetical protein